MHVTPDRAPISCFARDGREQATSTQPTTTLPHFKMGGACSRPNDERLFLWTVPLPSPTARATDRMPTPASSNRRASVSLASGADGRPSLAMVRPDLANALHCISGLY